jgi:hypothetical protein
MRPTTRALLAAAAALPALLNAAGTLNAQAANPAVVAAVVPQAKGGAAPAPAPVFGPDDDRERLDQVIGVRGTAGYLLREGDRLPPARRDSAALAATVLVPRVRMTWNSALPFSLNDGPMWAGRGANVEITTGVRFEAGPLAVTLAPQLLLEQNRDFQTLPYLWPSPRRDPLAAPWHPGPSSIDMPQRYGRGAVTSITPGQSSVALRAGAVRLGFSTANQWWGPGIRNALVMSSNAGGVPRAFVRTDRPARTPLGDVEAVWQAGWLTGSGWFETDHRVDHRSLAAFAGTLRLAADSNVTLGLARAAYSPMGAWHGFAARALDAFRPANTDTAGGERAREQLFSVFGRWVFPQAGLETYAELARRRMPQNLRDFLSTARQPTGYTLGLQWSEPVKGGRLFRVQTELSTVEQGLRQSFYTSDVIPRGYTQRGQVVGAAEGPGGSSQFVAGDLVGPRGSLGLTLARYRWDNDAFLTFTDRPLGHDVSLVAGLRATRRLRRVSFDAELLAGRRLNYLFQNSSVDFENLVAVDVQNYTLNLGFSAAAP